MHKKRFFMALGLWGLLTGVSFATTTMSVQVNKADIRETPSYLGKIVTSLAYGDKVTVQSQDGAWLQVTSSGQSGWLHNSALTKKNIVMKSGAGAQTSASSGEMALAGKGFNSDVEKQFKDNHKDINAKEGKLQSAGGAK